MRSKKSRMSCSSSATAIRRLVLIRHLAARPRRRTSFTLVEPRQLQSLAVMLKTALLKLHTGLENPDFNLTIDDVPRGDEDKDYFRWHMRILPRLTRPAGFEMGSGMSINTVLPEDAAASLREVPVVC